MSAAQPTERPRQDAIRLLDDIKPEDIAAGAGEFNTWLLQNSGGYVDLAKLKDAAAVVPVLGNIMALVDVLDDVITLTRKPSDDPFLWASLGINLIGLIPGPGGAARMSLRVVLRGARQELARAGMQGAKAVLTNSLIQILADDLAATYQGELTTFIQDAQAKLNGYLDEACKVGEAKLNELASGIEGLLVSSKKGDANAAKILRSLKDDLAYDPDKQLTQPWAALWHVYTALGAAAAAVVVPRLLPDQAQAAMRQAVGTLRTIVPRLRPALMRLTDPNVQHTIGWLLTQLLSKVGKHKGTSMGANVPVGKTGRAEYTRHAGARGAVRNEKRATSDGVCHKNCKGGTGGSISFALGAETLNHTDFTLPGLFPIEWTRTYRSDLAAYDDGELGARWITPYTTRIDITPDGGLQYHGADGRSQSYALPKVGGHHHDAIEQVFLSHPDDATLTITRGFDTQETYRRHGQHYRLESIELRGGKLLTLHYEHRVGDRTVLSDLITWQSQTIQSHVGTRVDEAGRIIELWLVEEGEPVRQLARYQYDDANDLVIAQCEHASHWAYTYQSHLITRYTDRTGRGMNLRWDGTEPNAKAIREWADDGSYDTKLEWDKHIRLTYVTDAHGNETWYFYDVLGYIDRIWYPDGLSEWFERDAAKNVTRHILPDGRNEDYDYDARGNLLRHRRADDSVIHYAYDSQDQLIKVRDAEGGLWQRDYDPRGNLTEEVDPLGNKTEYAYNKAGLPVEITDAKGGKKQLAYNPAGQLTRYTDCSNKTSTWKYDERGQLTQFTDAAGGTTRYEYEAGQLTKLIHPDNTTEQFERDAEGRLLKHTDALYRQTTWTYSEAGLIRTRTDASNGKLEYRWDKLGRLTGLTNENHAQTTFSYDPVGRLLKETGFDGRDTLYTYERASGTLIRATEANTVVTAFDFDEMGRLTARYAGFLDKEGKVKEEGRESFAYDGNGRLALAENRHSRLQWFYDAAGNNIREHQHYKTDNQVAVWRHEYDELNQRSATIRPDGHRVDVLTYGSGHVHGVHLDGQELVGFERDDLHRETLRTQGNRLTQSQAYDPAGRLKEQTLKHLDRTNAYVNRRQYRYDVVGQLSGIDDTRRGGLHYAYDPVGRLLQATSSLGQETFDFDPAGNLLDDPTLRTFAADPATGRPEFSTRLQGRNSLVDNLLKDYAGTHYEYSARGNLLKRTINGKTERFTWDVFSRLSGYSNGKFSVGYEYDALGRRIRKSSQTPYFNNPRIGENWNHIRHAQQNREAGCSTTVYGWEGDTLAWECQQEADVTDGTHWPTSGPSRTTHYLYEPGTFVPLAQATRHGPMQLHKQPVYADEYDIDTDPLWTTAIEPTPFDSLAWYQCDHLGTPQELTDEHGDVVWSAEYKAWGEAKQVITDAARKAGIQNPIRFQGQYYDCETGLHYNRHRYYDPTSGRFISKDPIGLAGGINVYQYAPNPVGWIDPFGLKCQSGLSSRAARREAMRQAGIPTSQQPISQSRNASGREYRYEVPQVGGGVVQATVQQQTMDVSHQDEPHWEAGKVKVDPITGETRMNDYGRPKIANPKGKAYYRGCDE